MSVDPNVAFVVVTVNVDCVASEIAKLCDTLVAASYSVLPACEAVSEHVPALSMVTEYDDTVQTVVSFDSRITARPELAVGDNENASAAHARSVGSSNVIVCDACEMVNSCVTLVAAV